MHLDPDCTGYWTPGPGARYLACSGCAAAFAPTPRQLLAALQENHAGLVGLRLRREGSGAKPDRRRSSDPGPRRNP